MKGHRAFAVMWVATAAVGVTVAPATASPPPPKLPAPTFMSVSKEVLIPMDDGVRLAATIAFPSRDGQTPLPGRFPVVEGNFFSPREARDGHHLIEHLGTQPYSTGKVGMAGGSYVGITQYLAAEQQPPHLAAIAPQVAISDLYREGYTHGGIPNLSFDAQYIAVQGAPGVVGTNTDPFLLEAPLTDPPGRYDVSAMVFEFLDKHLRGAATPQRPAVEFYLQAANEHVSASRWPPASTRSRRLDLGSGSRQYVTNPAAGFSLAFNKYGTVAATPYVPTDQRLEGPHGLTVRTPVLDRPLDLVGPMALHLAAASTAADTDWYAKVSDVAPDGGEALITEGSLRASHRALDPAKSSQVRPYHTHTDPRPIEPDRFYEYDIEIWPTAYRLAPGHRLQLRLTSTDLPTHMPGSAAVDRNRPQDARIDLLSPATNTVRLDDSHLVLTVR